MCLGSLQMIAFVSLTHGIFVEAAKETDLERKLHLFKYRFCLQFCYGLFMPSFLVALPRSVNIRFVSCLPPSVCRVVSR